MSIRSIETCCLSIVWIILLVLVGWPVAFLLNVAWIFLQPFESICYCCRGIVGCLERYVTWPREFGNAIWHGSVSCPQP